MNLARHPSGKLIRTPGGKLGRYPSCCCAPCIPSCIPLVPSTAECVQEGCGSGNINCFNFGDTITATVGSVVESATAPSQPHYDVFQHFVANAPGSKTFTPYGGAGIWTYYFPTVIKVEAGRAWSWYIELTYALQDEAGYIEWYFNAWLYTFNGCEVEVGDPVCAPEGTPAVFLAQSPFDALAGCEANGSYCGPDNDLVATGVDVNEDYLDPDESLTITKFDAPNCCFCHPDDLPDEVDVTININTIPDCSIAVPGGARTFRMMIFTDPCRQAGYVSETFDIFFERDGCDCVVLGGLMLTFDGCAWCLNLVVQENCFPQDEHSECDESPVECGADYIKLADCETPYGTYTSGAATATVEAVT